MIALTLVTALFIVTFVELSARAAGPNLKVKTAQTIVATWRCQDKIPQARTPARSPWKPHSIGFRRAELQRWQERWRRCTYILRERARQWNWQAFLPDKWRRVGVCETGLNWHHHNSMYTSAFGISVSEYDRDARYMGVRPWYVRGHGDPSPWEQYQAAVGHYKRFGGFSGWGCRNA